jgi:hypothetical protein
MPKSYPVRRMEGVEGRKSEMEAEMDIYEEFEARMTSILEMERDIAPDRKKRVARAIRENTKALGVIHQRANALRRVQERRKQIRDQFKDESTIPPQIAEEIRKRRFWEFRRVIRDRMMTKIEFPAQIKEFHHLPVFVFNSESTIIPVRVRQKEGINRLIQESMTRMERFEIIEESGFVWQFDPVKAVFDSFCRISADSAIPSF